MRRPIHSDPRIEFTNLQSRLEARQATVVKDRARIGKQFEQELYTACRQRGIAWPSNAPVRTIASKHPGVYEPLMQAARAEAESFDKAFRDEGESLRRRMSAIAALCQLDYLDPKDQSEWELYFSVSDYQYATQTAAMSYAKGRVAQERWAVGFCDPRVYYAERTQLHSAELWVNLKGLDIAILKARVAYEGIPIGEYLRRTWAMGLNPRVFNPYLPQGLEAKMGIDYMGMDTRAEYFVCHRCGRRYRQQGVMRNCSQCGFELTAMLGKE